MKIELDEIKGGDAILFSATWCGPCRQIKQRLTDMGVEYKEVECDEIGKEVKELYGVSKVPTLVIFDDNKEEKERRSAQAIIEFYENSLDNCPSADKLHP